MGSETRPSNIPIIDFTKPELIPKTPEWESVRTQVRRAIEEYGCFQALFHGISPTLQADLFDSLKDLFDLPLETKKLNTSESDALFHGYIPKNPAWATYESFGIDHPTMAETVERFTSTMWPQGNSSFCATFKSFVKETSELAETIRRMILESLGLGQYLEENMSSTKYLLRVMKYDGSETGEPVTGLPDHIDKNEFTLMNQNQIDGLKVQTRDREWIDVKFLPNSFVVVMGESLNAWTNGRIYVPNHRVMVSESEERYSVGLFSQYKEGYLVTAPKELVDEEHPLLYKPFDFYEYMTNRQLEKQMINMTLKDQYGA